MERIVSRLLITVLGAGALSLPEVVLATGASGP